MIKRGRRSFFASQDGGRDLQDLIGQANPWPAIGPGGAPGRAPGLQGGFGARRGAPGGGGAQQADDDEHQTWSLEP